MYRTQEMARDLRGLAIPVYKAIPMDESRRHMVTQGEGGIVAPGLLGTGPRASSAWPHGRGG